MLGVALGISLLARGASAHDLGLSKLVVVARPAELSLSLQLDGDSVADFLEQTDPELSDMEKSRFPEFQEVLLGYVDDRLVVERGGARCVRRRPTAFLYFRPSNQLWIDADFMCPLGVESHAQLTLQSTLFHDSETPHNLMVVVVNGDTQGRYMLDNDRDRVRADLDALGRKALTSAAPAPAPAPASEPDSQAAAEELRESAENERRTATPMESGFLTFLWKGMGHIFSGLDHILFVLSLLLVTRTWKDLAWVVTSFTIAHSITLVLGVLGHVTLSARIVEPVIALSIVYVAVENIVRKEPRARIAIIFGFGLIHGLGFSGSLRAMHLPTGELASALVGFNVGVELGQLAVVAPLFPLLLWLQARKELYRAVLVGGSGLAAVIATVWLIERVIT